MTAFLCYLNAVMKGTEEDCYPRAVLFTAPGSGHGGEDLSLGTKSATNSRPLRAQDHNSDISPKPKAQSPLIQAYTPDGGTDTPMLLS